MATPVSPAGANVRFGAGVGDEDRVSAIDCIVRFCPGTDQIASVTTAWKLSELELEEVKNTGVVMLNQLYGLAPHFIGSESVVREFILDHGSSTPKG